MTLLGHWLQGNFCTYKMMKKSTPRWPLHYQALHQAENQVKREIDRDCLVNRLYTLQSTNVAVHQQVDRSGIWTNRVPHNIRCHHSTTEQILLVPICRQDHHQEEYWQYQWPKHSPTPSTSNSRETSCRMRYCLPSNIRSQKKHLGSTKSIPSSYLVTLLTQDIKDIFQNGEKADVCFSISLQPKILCV